MSGKQTLAYLALFHFVTDSGADQHAGRVAAGLNPLVVDFASLPPHFSPTSLAGIPDCVWRSITPDFGPMKYENMPSSTKAALPLLFATLIHHAPWLATQLPPRHRIFEINAFKQNVEYVHLVHLKVFECNSDGCCMHATGVPATVMHTVQLEKLSKDVRSHSGCICVC